MLQRNNFISNLKSCHFPLKYYLIFFGITIIVHVLIIIVNNSLYPTSIYSNNPYVSIMKDEDHDKEMNCKQKINDLTTSIIDKRLLEEVSNKKLAYVLTGVELQTMCAAMIAAVQLRRDLKVSNDIDVNILILPSFISVIEKFPYEIYNIKYTVLIESDWPPPNMDTLGVKIFQMYEYDRIIYLDGSVMLKKNIDHLFFLPSIQLAVPRAWWITQTDHIEPQVMASIMVLEPSPSVYRRLRQYTWKGRMVGQRSLSDVIQKELGQEAMILPSIYSVTDAIWRTPNQWGENNNDIPTMGMDMSTIQEKLMLIHFSDPKNLWEMTYEERMSQFPNALPYYKELHQEWHAYRKEICRY